MSDIAVGLGSVILEPIWNSAYRGAERQLKPIFGLKNEVKVLESSLETIEEKMSEAEKVHLQAILKFLENKTENEDNMNTTNQWFAKLKGVYYDVNNVLDKWNTVKIMKKIEKSSKVWSLIPSFYRNRLSLLREIAFNMEALKEGLQKLNEKAIKLDEKLNGELIKNLKPATTSYSILEVYGREKEKEILMRKLEMSASNTQGGSSVDTTISILGMGGVGKTTLAQLVFTDESVQNFFVTIWVSVPYKFDLEKILKTIIEQVNPEKARKTLELHTLLDLVVKSIKGKTLLLVLDGVWAVEEKEWDPLIAAFRYSHPSSRILVTTQNYDAAQTMGAHNDSIIHLELLSTDDCWSIVKHLASEAAWNINQEIDQDLQEKFQLKSNRLPLVARTLEYRLRSQNTKPQWHRDFQSDIGDDEKKLFGSFFLNYYGLSRLQRYCFSYCSFFPRNYQLESDDVVEMWMSQDYFSKFKKPEEEGIISKHEKPEEEGLKCFQILARRCLFQDSIKDWNGESIKCKMQELVYDFAQFLTKHERIIKQRSSQRYEPVRHFTLLLKASEAQIPSSMDKKRNLRTLFVVRSETSTPPNPLSCDLLVKLTCLRTLNLSHCNIEQLPEDLDKLVHLRYLNLSGNSLKTLPNALCYLFNLQTLRLKGCTKLQRLPEQMGNLALKFRHLHVEGCDNLKALPKEIGKLTDLQTLDMFIIPSPDDPQNYKALKLEDLNQLEHLRGSLHICRCRNLDNASDLIQPANLILNGRRNYHVSLKLNFEGSSNSTRIRDEREILDALQPHSDLISLEIRGCMDTMYPNWINSLHCLKGLVLSGCRNWDSLPLLGRLQLLESLQIDDMDRVVNVGLQFLGIAGDDWDAISFPKLKELHFSCLTNWRIWEEEENDSTIMPCLASLHVSHCGNLEALPGFLRGITRLQNLTIDGCTILQQRCQEGVGEDWDKISRIPNIEIDGVTIRTSSGVELHASTSGNNAITVPESTAGPSTVMNSSNTRWYKRMMNMFKND